MRVGKGFTKLEILFLLAIVAILAAIALPAYRDYLVGGPHPSAHPDKNYAIVRTFFATDRSVDIRKDVGEMFGHERADLKYGIADVSIPRAHRMGQLESPSLWKFEFREDPEKHIVLLSATTVPLEQFTSVVEEKVNGSEKKSAFVFVHGYNTSFEDASRRTAQIAYDLGFDGAPIFYSWPSRGNEAAYTVDEQSIEWAEANIEKFLTGFLESSGAESIFLIAHSMGNRGLTRALKSVLDKNPGARSRITEVILAAPDIDAEVFERDIAPALIGSKLPITLYASSEDKALKASKLVHGYPRAGDSGDQLLIIDGIETIESTNVKTDFLGHSYFASSDSILADIFVIVHHGHRAKDRFRLEVVTSTEGEYWRFRR